MKYLVVSDNHGNRDCLIDIENKWQNKVDYMFHCGDSELDPFDNIWEVYNVVKGNCDYDSEYQVKKVIDTGQDVVFLTHGHLFNVNVAMEHLFSSAKEAGANIVLYGHTHKLGVEKRQGILFLNPGSISQPRGRFSHLKTYAIIEHRTDGIHVDYYNEQHEVQPNLSFFFPNDK